MADADAFLAKAEESLASAEDDFAKERFNSCARNAYYAAFQAAVAALLMEGIRPATRWEHRFVHARFAGVLVRRRKMYSSRYANTLIESLLLRNRADYSDTPIGRRQISPILEVARRLMRSVRERLNGNR